MDSLGDIRRAVSLISYDQTSASSILSSKNALLSFDEDEVFYAG